MNKRIDPETALAVARARLADGTSEAYAARAAGISVPTLRRWQARAEVGKPPRDYAACGRPASVAVSEEDAAILRQYVIRANIGRRRVSMAGGCRIAAMTPGSGLSEAVRAAILKPRADPGGLPKPVLDAVREVAAPAVVGRYRDSRDGLGNGLYAPGYLRVPEGDIGRRLAPMEKTVWDDGSTNFMLWVPWARGGDKCSDRFGARLIRGQMLACVDCGSGFCPHYSFVVRERDSYTAGDVCAALWAAWSAHGVPPQTVMEGGSWQANRTLDLCRRGGTEVISAKGRPNQKLVERFFGNVWTAHAALCPDGHIGRHRGETHAEALAAQACRDGRLDPRKAFPSLVEFLGGLDAAVDVANRTETVSPGYGRWVPAERFAADEPVSARPYEGLARLALPVIETRSVRRGGMVTVRAANAAGVDWDFAFAVRDGHLWEGARVSVAFDPRHPERGASVWLAGKQRHGPDALTVDDAAVSMGPAPVLEGGSILWWDSREQAREAKARARAAVLTAVRSADARGRMAGRPAGPDAAAPEAETLRRTAAQAWPERGEPATLGDLYA